MEIKEFKFNYGVVIYKHRFTINRSLDDYEEIKLDKCIMLELAWKSNINGTESWFETHIVYKDENNKPQIVKLKIEEYVVKVIHKGDMSINL